MVTQRQAKGIALRTAMVNGVDKYAYGRSLDGKQALIDAMSLSITEYFTRDKALDLTGNMFQGMDESMKKKAIDIVLNVTQDMVLQRLAGGRVRSLMEDLVLFGSTEFVAEQVEMRMPGTFA